MELIAVSVCAAGSRRLGEDRFGGSHRRLHRRGGAHSRGPSVRTLPTPRGGGSDGQGGHPSPGSAANRPPGRRHQRGLGGGRAGREAGAGRRNQHGRDGGCKARGGGLRRAASERHSHAPDEAVRGGRVQDDPAQGRLLLRRAEGSLSTNLLQN